MLHEKSGVVLRWASTPVSYKKDNAGNLTPTGRKDQHGRIVAVNAPLFQL